MISKFKKIVESSHAATIQGRLVTIDEAKNVCNAFNNLTQSNRATFINLPIDKILEFSTPLQSTAAAATKRPSILEYINKIESNKTPASIPTIINNIAEHEIEKPKLKPIEVVRETPILQDKPVQQEKIIEATIPVKEKEVFAPTSIILKESPSKDEFYQQLVEQLNNLKSKSNDTDSSIKSVDSRLDKLTESNTAIMNTFEKITEYIEHSNSTPIIKELHENIIANQKFISEHHNTLYENQAT